MCIFDFIFDRFKKILIFFYNQKRSLIISLISTLGSLFLIESILSYQNHANHFATASSKFGKPFDLKSCNQLITDLRSKNLPAYPSIGGGFFFRSSTPIKKRIGLTASRDIKCLDRRIERKRFLLSLSI